MFALQAYEVYCKCFSLVKHIIQIQLWFTQAQLLGLKCENTYEKQYQVWKNMSLWRFNCTIALLLGIRTCSIMYITIRFFFHWTRFRLYHFCMGTYRVLIIINHIFLKKPWQSEFPSRLIFQTMHVKFYKFDFFYILHFGNL